MPKKTESEFGTTDLGSTGRKTLVDRAYQTLREAIFDFELLPGDRFIESELAQRCGMSRTPVREALARLENEGYLQSRFRSGWLVKPFDFRLFENLYDFRIVLEKAAVQRLCVRSGDPPQMAELREQWIINPLARSKDGELVCRMDERFHQALIETCENAEIIHSYQTISDRIRIIRRLDFTKPERVTTTYREHEAIMRALLAREAKHATDLLEEHILKSKDEVRNITFHRLHTARTLRYEP